MKAVFSRRIERCAGFFFCPYPASFVKINKFILPAFLGYMSLALIYPATLVINTS